MILFSIIIPTFNRANFLPQAIGSVLAQNYSNWEMIVIDDASTDDTASLLATYQDVRIRSVRNEKNIERSASRNKGIELASGDYICFLDSDDFFLPHHLALLAELITGNSFAIGLFHTGVKQLDWVKHSERIVERSPFLNKVEDVLASHIPIHSVAIHKDILRLLKFDPQLKINEDVHLFARIAACYPLYYTPQISAVWVLHGSNTAKEEKDYLTPELKATRIIFNDSKILPHISGFYKRKKYFDLYSRLVYFHASNKKNILSVRYFIKGVLIDPLNRNNLTNFLNVIYHLPGGRWIKRTMQLFNR